MISRLRYGNTNTFFVRGDGGGLLIDTDYAGTLPAFFAEIKRQNIRLSDMTYLLATHYHPDHVGLVGKLTELGARLLLVDSQVGHVHFPDGIFAREGADYLPVDESSATVIHCGESRAFLHKLGIDGEIISTPSHSADSVSLVLDSGDCIVGDLEPLEYLDAYGKNPRLASDWERVLELGPRRILYAHANERLL